MNPWFVIYKAGKPREERVGACLLPYQTGRAQVVDCDDTGIIMRIRGRNVTVTTPDRVRPGFGGQTSILETNNPGAQTYPTLTILAAFANPKRLKNLQQRERIVSSIRARGAQIATSLRLRHAPLMAPNWMALEPTADLQVVQLKEAHCSRPLRILLDSSLPFPEVLKVELVAAIGCPVEFELTTADRYFSRFERSDIGVAWFTPDDRSLYNYYSAFDCGDRSVCYFDWNDRELQREIDSVRASSENQGEEHALALEIERRILRRGYAAPIAEMNWWIRKGQGAEPIHPSGLAQVHVGDFL